MLLLEATSRLEEVYHSLGFLWAESGRRPRCLVEGESLERGWPRASSNLTSSSFPSSFCGLV